jgi:hypothetical protein
MARKRAPGGGRKPRGKAPAEHFNTRMTPEVRKLLQAEARLHGWSLSREIEERLKGSLVLGDRDIEDRATKALVRVIAEMAARTQAPKSPRGPGINWRNNRFLFEAFKAALNQFLDQLAPEGKATDSEHPQFKTPEALANAIVFSVEDQLQNTPDSHAALVRTGFFHALPHIARDLGIQRKGGKS